LIAEGGPAGQLELTGDAWPFTGDALPNCRRARSIPPSIDEEKTIVLFAAETWPFTVATFLMLLIAIVEGVAMVIGASLSEHVQHALPDPWDNIHGPFDKLLGWLYVGRVPVLVLLVLFLAGFSISGFALNLVTQRVFGFWVPVIISVPAAFFATLPIVRILGAGLARIIPTDQTYAVSFETLVGRVATIVNGTARPGYPAQARVPNEHGQNLYVMVEPDTEGVTFQSGERVLLTKQISGSRFACAVNPWPDLI
jgi:hypothetical protein